MIIDKLYDRVANRGGVCLGLDSSLDFIPKALKDKYSNPAEAIFAFNREIIDNTLDIVAIYKPQIAYYEAYGFDGIRAYIMTLDYLRQRDLLVIGDIKRGDIASTASMYAKAHFTGDFEVDFITLSPYMGFDSVSPYLDYLKNGDKGVFVLVRTSNPGAKDIEYLECGGQKVYHHVAKGLAKIGEDFVGKCGYSSLGFVVGGTYADEAVEIRQAYKNSFFLIPGYGAQGGKASDIRLYLDSFNGAVVNSSRGIICAYKNHNDGEENFGFYARQAVLEMKEDIGYEK